MSIQVQPNDFCPHIQSGEAEAVGGVHFPLEQPNPVSMALCQQCMDLAYKSIDGLVPLNEDAVEMLDSRVLDADVIDADYE